MNASMNVQQTQIPLRTFFLNSHYLVVNMNVYNNTDNTNLFSYICGSVSPASRPICCRTGAISSDMYFYNKRNKHFNANLQYTFYTIFLRRNVYHSMYFNKKYFKS